MLNALMIAACLFARARLPVTAAAAAAANASKGVCYFVYSRAANYSFM